jgi:hypothetical protein
MANAVTKTIYEQLGGNQFTVMTGAKLFVSDGNKLRFRIGKNASKANKVVIALEADDTYTMTFSKFTPYDVKIAKDGTLKERQESDVIIAEHKGVYCDMLQDIFTEVTGMHTRL